jgi:hypothetical protein
MSPGGSMLLLDYGMPTFCKTLELQVQWQQWQQWQPTHVHTLWRRCWKIALILSYAFHIWNIKTFTFPVILMLQWSPYKPHLLGITEVLDLSIVQYSKEYYESSFEKLDVSVFWGEVGRHLNHITFLMRCKSQDIILKRLSKKTLYISKLSKVVQCASKALLRDGIQFSWQNKASNLQQIQQLGNFLTSLGSDSDQQCVFTAVDSSFIFIHIQSSSSLISNITRCCQPQLLILWNVSIIFWNMLTDSEEAVINHKLTPYHSKSPHLHGLLKNHRADIPLRL